MQYGHEAVKDIIQVIEELVAEAGKPKRSFDQPEVDEALHKAVDALANPRLDDLNSPKNKEDRYRDIDTFIAEVQEQMAEEFPEKEKPIAKRISELLREDLRRKTLGGVRADGRKPDEIRPVPFTRGSQRGPCPYS